MFSCCKRTDDDVIMQCILLHDTKLCILLEEIEQLKIRVENQADNKISSLKKELTHINNVHTQSINHMERIPE